MTDKSLLWITGGSEGLAVARKLHGRADILCWGDFIMYGEDELMPQYRVQDKVSKWLRDADMASNDRYLITDGFQSFSMPHLLEGQVYRSSLDFESDLGGCKTSKAIADCQKSAYQTRKLFQDYDVSTSSFVSLDSIQDALDYFDIDDESQYELIVNKRYYKFTSGNSAKIWLSELCNRTRVRTPIFISTLPQGFKVSLIGLFHDGLPIAAPLLDLGGAICSISPNSPMYANTLDKLSPFLSDQRWTGPFVIDVTIGKTNVDYSVLATNFMAEMRHCSMPCMYELYPGDIEDMIYDILEGSPIRWKPGWACYSKMLLAGEPNLEAAWAEKDISNHANLWWCDVLETENTRRLTGKHFCTLTQSHKKDPRKAFSQIEAAQDKLVVPDHVTFALPDNKDAFKNFAILTSWELCKSEWRSEA